MGKADKDPKKPKGRMSAYAFFVQTCREEHRMKHPNQQVEFAQFSKRCADRWKVRTAIFSVEFHSHLDWDISGQIQVVNLYLLKFCVFNVRREVVSIKLPSWGVQKPYRDGLPTWVAKSASWYMNDPL